MYKLREQRLKDFYTGDQDTMASRKHAASTHADSITDQGFMTLKSKEIRDSESPTRDIHRRQGDNNYWNTVQHSSYNTQGDEGNLLQSYERTSTGIGRSEDGNTQSRLEGDERGYMSTKTTEDGGSKTVSDQQGHDSHIATTSHTKVDGGEMHSFSTSKEHQENKSSVTESKDSSSSFKSTKWETSSSSSSRMVTSSTNRITSGTNDLKAITTGDDVDFTTMNYDNDFNTSTIRRVKNSSNQDTSKRYQTNEVQNSSIDNQVNSSTSFINAETRNNLRNSTQDGTFVDIRDDHFGGLDSRRDSTSTYTSEVTSNVDDYSAIKDTSSKKKVTQDIKQDLDRSNVVTDQKILTEIHKLDSFLSTQNTPGTNTPISPRSVMGDVNWTVVSNTDGEFVYKDDKGVPSSGPRSTPIKQPDSLDLPKDGTEGQYVTTYNEHYTTKRISMDVSPTHDKFARSLRQTPPGTPRSLSRQSLDRSSPERKSKSSPRSSPDKERRTSVGSYTIERPSSARRKTSEVVRQTGTSTDSSLKNKRKFSTTQTKAAAKARSSTPGTSPSTSPSRKQRERSDSPSSASDSDASQITYQKSTASSRIRADVVRKNLMDSFDKEPHTPETHSSDTTRYISSRPSSPEKSPTRKSSTTIESKTSSILRKDSRTDSKSTISTNVVENKIPSAIAPHVRDKSPEYSSEGSIGKEIKHSQIKTSPDSSPDRKSFTPIKQFRTSPELSSETIQVTANEINQMKANQTIEFIEQEVLDAQRCIDKVHEDVQRFNKAPSPDNKATPVKEPCSPEKEPTRRKSSTSKKVLKSRSPSPQKARSPSPGKQQRDEPVMKQKELSPTRKHSQHDRTPQIPSQTNRKPSLSQRSPSPQKDQPRSSSPTKRISTPRKPSIPARSPSPTKTTKSRSPSPSKVETIINSTVTRRSSLKKDSTYKAPPSTRRSSRQETPSPVKDTLRSRSSSPKKESPQRHSYSPSKSKSPSPQRTTNKRSRHEVSSPSISPCSSPERLSDRSPEKSKTVRRTSGPKSPETVRTTKRTSIPRADQTKSVRKTVQTKIEITAKPASKIPSTINKGKPGQSPLNRTGRTESQSSLDRQSIKKSYSTTIKRTVDKPKEPINKTAMTKKVTTTATISLQKPTTASQVKHTSSSTVSRTTTYKRTPSKENVPKKEISLSDKKQIVTTTTKRIASRTNTPKSKPTTYVETNKSFVLSSPEPSMSRKEQAEQFIDQLKREDETIHGFKGETINIEIVDNGLENDLENETRPELYPETEDEDDLDKQNINSNIENTQHLTEKTINIDSKRKMASQFVVTVKKPTAPTKAAAKPVTTRSSSGPVRSSPQTSVKPTTPVKTTTNKRQTTNVQKADSLNLIRTTSEKNVSKNSVQRRQISRPEMTTNTQQTPKLTSTKHVTETGIASRNVTTAKTATIKRMPSKTKRTSSVSSSFSEDEDVDIPSVITPNQEEQEYIEELEEMRRKEEMEYASKLTATSNQENQLLSVIIQHPKSSRESSPDISNRSQPFCAVSDDGGANPRYADLISEPEDVEVFEPKNKPKLQNYIQSQSRNEQVTDLDDESEAEDIKLNVSVADRVTHFIETSNAHKAPTTREDSDSQVTVDSSQNVLRAKAMFETIANNQKAPPAPGNRPVDILSRPSVFEARRGQTAPKPIPSDTIPRNESPNNAQRHGSIETEYQQHENVEVYETNNYDIHVDVKELESLQTKSPSSVDESLVLEKRNSLTSSKTSPLKKETTITTKIDQKPKTEPSTRPIKKEDTPLGDKKRPVNDYKPKPFEKTISATAEISSKRAFFERKAQTQTTPNKETKLYSPVKERRPLTDSIQNKENIRGPSPPRKTSQTTEFIQNERKSSRVSPERKPSIPSSVKERKPSLKSESPERKVSLSKSVKERRSSFTKEDSITTQKTTIQKKDSFTSISQGRKISSPSESPERRAPITQKNFPDHVSRSEPAQKRSPSPVKDRKPSITRASPERTSQRKSSRTSPDRAMKSPDRSSPSPKYETETVELNKAGKFGVTLRRTSSTTSAGTPRRSSIPGETQEIEEVTDMALLEIMMEKAVGYEQRRRIRSQMRVVKKILDDKTSKSYKQKSPTRSPTRDVKVTKESVTKTSSTTFTKKPEDRRPSSPSKGKEKIPERHVPEKARAISPSKVPEGRKQEPIYNGHTPSNRSVSPDRRSPTLRTKSPQTQPGRQSPVSQRRDSQKSPQNQRRESQPGQSTLTNGYHRPEVRETETVRRSSKTDTVEVSSTSTVRSQKRTETLVESGVDCITSSYGVGPTDELGRPLFGLRALRRSNTNKQLTDDVEVRKEEPRVSKEEPVSDSRGRPLFGGLKALRAIETYEDSPEMPEQTSTQLRELVQHHEKVVRETNGPQDQPKQKPRAKLRDSFISTEDEPTSPGHLNEVNSLNRGFSLKSIIQKHENIANTGGDVRSEMESSHTVVSSRSVMSSDGSVSLSRDVIQGEISAKNGEEPVGKITRTQYTYQSPQGDDKGVNKVTTTTTALGGRRTSGPKITEIEDEPQRKSSLKTSTKRSSVTEVTEEVSGRKASERITNKRGSLRKSPSEDEDRKIDRRFSNQQDEEDVQKVTSRVSSTQKFATSDDSGSNKRISSTVTRQSETRTTTSSPSLRRSEEESTAEDKRKTVVRGDSVRALQHKFQQATENAVTSAPRSSSTRAGLILRTSSFTNADQQESVSSTLKQSTNVSAEKRNGRQSPDKARREATDVTSRKGSLSDAISTRRDSLSKTSSDVTSRRESLTKDSTTSTTSSRVTESHQTSSFLDNTSRVTGVQDILTRMRNADLVNESGDTDADREARALLNKFLGASVILQGMEQGMRSAGISSDTVQDSNVGSAALVRSVEKQRVATTRQKEEDIENIWDEQVLKSLLERCTDYEGRRKLRARLRTVMAEHKACADLVAVTGDNGANSSHREESETKQVTTKTDGGSVTRTEVHTRTSTNRLTKASSVSSPFAKFRQLERQNSAPSVGQATPLFKITDPRVARSASSIKDRLLSWVQAQTREYKNIQIDNFSTSWNNGLAFCALIHHFCPEAFDYDKLIPEQRRHNFELAFRVAEEEAGIAPLLDVEDMVVMRRPDWKCVFTYVQSVYRRFHSTPEAVRC